MEDETSQELEGARHTATRRRRGMSRGIDYLGSRGSIEGKGEKTTKETEDVTWGSQSSPQGYYKYGPSEAESGSSVRPP